MLSELGSCTLLPVYVLLWCPPVVQIFVKLAHSSIMCLNESSMDKLYDLITMGFKFQVRGLCDRYI